MLFINHKPSKSHYLTYSQYAVNAGFIQGEFLWASYMHVNMIFTHHSFQNMHLFGLKVGLKALGNVSQYQHCKLDNDIV